MGRERRGADTVLEGLVKYQRSEVPHKNSERSEKRLRAGDERHGEGDIKFGEGEKEFRVDEGSFRGCYKGFLEHKKRFGKRKVFREGEGRFEEGEEKVLLVNRLPSRF